METKVLLEVPIGVSNRHVHLSQEHLEELFGAGYEMTHLKDLGQPGQYACEEVVTVEGSKGAIEKVRVLGPPRRRSQVEISRSDGFKLGIKAPVKDSGDHEGTPGCVLIGPKGRVTLTSGVMLAARHIHMTPDTAERYGIKDKDHVSVLVEGERGAIFNNVLIRVREDFALEFHLDVDEANGVGANNDDTGTALIESKVPFTIVR